MLSANPPVDKLNDASAGSCTGDVICIRLAIAFNPRFHFAGEVEEVEQTRKRPRLSIEERSDLWAFELARSSIPELKTAADVREFIKQPLPSPILVEASRPNAAFHEHSIAPRRQSRISPGGT